MEPLGRRTATIANWRDGSPASATSDDDVRSTFAVNALGELIGYCPAVQVFVGGCDPAQSNETQAWRFTYDVLGNRATQVPPLNATLTALDTRTWTYDAGGRLTVVTDRTSGGTTSRHTDYTYDGVGRVLTERTYLGGGTGNLELEFTTSWNADGSRASRSFDGTAASPAQGTDTLTFTYDAMGRPDQVRRSSTVLTDYGWNADDTLASRLDDGVGTIAFSYDWADRQTGISAPALFGSGSVSQTYRLDGTLASRSTPNGVTAAVTYDAAKRPVGVSFGAHSLSRAYDRAGNVTADGRSFSGVSGDAGTGTGTAQYSYDALSRVVASSGLSRTDSYTYDRNGNRLTAVEGATTVAYTYDRADQATTQTISGVDTSFAYNAWGDLTSAADRDNGVTAHTYDAGGRLVSLTPPGASAATFSYDALGRPATRTIGAASLTYAYVGWSSVSSASVPSAGSATYGLLDATASRVALNTGGTTAWSTFDLHGNLVGATASGSGTIVSALRYDAYGATLDAYTAGAGATAVPWRYQGRLDLSPDPDEPLYDYGARRYRPSAGAFTQLDTYPGSAADPRSMNRFVYAHANPTTLIDPTGHCVGFNCSVAIDGYAPFPTAGPNHAIQIAAAQQQVAASTSWAPANSTNTKNTADAMAQAAQQARANVAQAAELERFRNITVRTPKPNPANTGFDLGDIGGLFVGVGEGAWALGASVVGIGGWALSTATDEQQRVLNGIVWDYMVNNADEAVGAMWSGMVDPMVDDWSAGNQGEALGRAMFDIGSAIVPLTKLATARYAGRLSDVGRTAAAPARLAQDVAVDGLRAPLRLSTGRSIGGSASQNAALQAEIANLRGLRAGDIRVNQTQINAAGLRVGINRPDLQYTLNGVRHYVEFEVPGSLRGAGHVTRLQANDPLGTARYLIVP